MDIWQRLAEPFPEEDIEWRLERCGESNGKIWALCLAYVTNRAIMQRLDDVVGPEHWKNKFIAGPDIGFMCGISIRERFESVPDNDKWITKWDGADKTNVEAIKGGFSGSMKRAAVQWGIGRYLYKLEHNFAIIDKDGKYKGQTKDKKHFKWNPPQLPDWALPANTSAKNNKEPKKEKAKQPASFIERCNHAKELYLKLRGGLEKLEEILMTYKAEKFEDIPKDQQEEFISDLQREYNKIK